MEITYQYKEQSDGTPSWKVTEKDSKGTIVNAYMVYSDPSKKPVPVIDFNAFIDSLSADEINYLKQKLNI